MQLEITTTYTLSEADVKRAIAEFIERNKGHPPEKQDVKIEVSAGSPYYNQFDQGSPPTFKVKVEVKG